MSIQTTIYPNQMLIEEVMDCSCKVGSQYISPFSSLSASPASSCPHVEECQNIERLCWGCNTFSESSYEPRTCVNHSWQSLKTCLLLPKPLKRHHIITENVHCSFMVFSKLLRFARSNLFFPNRLWKNVESDDPSICAWRVTPTMLKIRETMQNDHSFWQYVHAAGIITSKYTVVVFLNIQILWQ